MSDWINYHGNQIRAEKLTDPYGARFLVAKIPDYADERSISDLQAQQAIQIRKGQQVMNRRDSTTWEVTSPPNEWGKVRILRKSYPPTYQQNAVTEEQLRRDLKFISA